MPRPRPGGSFPRRFFQPEAATTLSMQAPRPIEPTRRQFAVSVFAGCRWRRRISAGSMPRSHGDLVELHLEGEARLRRAVAALGAARRLVGEDARAVEAVRRDLVGHGLERARVVRRGDAVGAVGAAVEQGLEVHRRDRAVLLDAGPHLHQHRVAAAVAVEDLLAREADLDGPAGDARELGDDDLVVEGVGLAAEAAAVGRRDDADLRGRHLEHLRERAVHVVRRLRRGPERQLSVGAEVGDRRVLLERQVRVALVEEEVLVDAVGAREPLLRVAELHRHELVDVACVAVVVDRRGRPARGRRRSSRSEAAARSRRAIRSSASKAASSSTAATAATGSPTKRTRSVHSACSSCEHGEDPEGRRQVLAGGDRDDAGRRERLRDVDRTDPRVGDLRAQELAVEHPRQHHVVGELRLAGDLRGAVDLAVGAADDAGHAAASVVGRLARPAAVSRDAARWRVRSSKSYPYSDLLARHGLLAAHPGGGELDGLEDLDVAGAAAEVPGERLADLRRASGFGFSSSSAFAVSRKPGVQ